MPKVVKLNTRPRLIVTTPPVLQIILGNVLVRLVLLQTLQRPVVLLVEPPVLVMRDPVAIELLGDRVVRPDGSLQQGGVCHVERITVLFEDLSSLLCLQDAELGQANVLPACEAIHHVEL